MTRSVDIVNPATGATIRTVAECGGAEVDAAVATAMDAFRFGPWPTMAPSERARLLVRIADAVEAGSETLSALETLNNGQPITETRAQLPRVPEWFRYHAGLLATRRQAVVPGDGSHLTYQQRVPLGVCGIITPFTQPLSIVARSLSAALANGNTVVVKPSELTPLTTLALADILAEAGLPAGVLTVITGAREAGERLTEHAGVAKITLTGGARAGRSATVAAAARLARATAHLGGITPVVVFDDVDPVDAAEGAAFAAFVGAGQSCVAASPFLVQRGVYDPFVSALSERARSLRIGDPTLPQTQLGPLISARQRERVQNLIGLGVAEGARLAAGGAIPDLPKSLRDGYFLEPTVLAEATIDMAVAQQEVLGPVAVVIPFDDEDDAVGVANGNRHGAGAAVWTLDIGRAHRVASRITAGVVWVNDHHRLESALPWGGAEGFDDFSWVKTIAIRTAAEPVGGYGGRGQ